jgi:predicted nucleic acid-binding protein
VRQAVFADTFFWIAVTNPADRFHPDAHGFDLTDTILVTTDEVLVEFLTFFSDDPWLRAKAARTAEASLEQAKIRVIPQTRESFLAGLALYKARPDKRYSLTDCISMAVMHRERLSDVLTNDRHFEQEGFRRLVLGQWRLMPAPRPSPVCYR